MKNVGNIFLECLAHNNISPGFDLRGIDVFIKVSINNLSYTLLSIYYSLYHIDKFDEILFFFIARNQSVVRNNIYFIEAIFAA